MASGNNRYNNNYGNNQGNNNFGNNNNRNNNSGNGNLSFDQRQLLSSLADDKKKKDDKKQMILLAKQLAKASRKRKDRYSSSSDSSNSDSDDHKKKHRKSRSDRRKTKKEKEDKLLREGIEKKEQESKEAREKELRDKAFESTASALFAKLSSQLDALKGQNPQHTPRKAPMQHNDLEDGEIPDPIAISDKADAYEQEVKKHYAIHKDSPGYKKTYKPLTIYWKSSKANHIPSLKRQFAALGIPFPSPFERLIALKWLAYHHITNNTDPLLSDSEY